MVYVLSKDGQPLMPICRHGKVRRLLNSKRARVVRREPFTIQLLFDTENNVSDLMLGVDTGSSKIGCAVVGNVSFELLFEYTSSFLASLVLAVFFIVLMGILTLGMFLGVTVIFSTIGVEWIGYIIAFVGLFIIDALIMEYHFSHV